LASLADIHGGLWTNLSKTFDRSADRARQAGGGAGPRNTWRTPDSIDFAR
jgi:hypothetical protein